MPFPSSCYTPIGAAVQATGAGVLTASQAALSTAFAITVLTNNVYWTMDGSAPTSSNGLIIQAGSQPLVLPIGPGGSTPLVHKFQAVTGTATVNLQSLGN